MLPGWSRLGLCAPGGAGLPLLGLERRAEGLRLRGMCTLREGGAAGRLEQGAQAAHALQLVPGPRALHGAGHRGLLFCIDADAQEVFLDRSLPLLMACLSRDLRL